MIIYKENSAIKIIKHNNLANIPVIKFKHTLTDTEFTIDEENIDVSEFFYKVNDFTPEKDGEYQYSVFIDDELMESGLMLKGLNKQTTEENLTYVYGE